MEHAPVFGQTHTYLYIYLYIYINILAPVLGLTHTYTYIYIQYIHYICSYGHGDKGEPCLSLPAASALS